MENDNNNDVENDTEDDVLLTLTKILKKTRSLLEPKLELTFALYVVSR